MTDLKLRLEQWKAELLKEIENAAKVGESKRLQGLASDLERVEGVIAKYDAVLDEAVSLLGAERKKSAPTHLGNALDMLRGSSVVEGQGAG